MKKLMVLGAGISQVPLIQKAKDMGLYVIVMSRKGDYPGISYADRYYEADTTNVEKIAEIARLEQINGICTTGTDAAIPSIGHVNDDLNLYGVSYHSALLSTNKLMMKEAFRNYGVRTAAYRKVKSKEEALLAFEQLTTFGSAVIFKAVDCGASKGIIKVNDFSQFEYAYQTVRKATKQSFFLVEQFIEGTEFGAQAFVLNQEFQFILPHGDVLFYGDTGVPVGHYVPYDISDAVLEDMKSQIKRSIKALEMDNCAVNADFILMDDKVYVLEVGARAGATCLPELVSTYYGFDYYEQIILAALQQEPGFCKPSKQSPGQACVCELIISDVSGQIVSQENKNEMHSDILSLAFDYKAGDTIQKFKVGTDRIGQIVVKGEDLEKALKRLKEVRKNIVIEIR